MKKMLKKIIITIIIIAMLIPLSSIQATEEKDAIIELEYDGKIVAGQTVTLNIKLSEIQKKIDTVIAIIEYDEEIFEELKEEDLEPLNKWNYPIYNANDKIFLIEKTGGTIEDETIMSINLKVKENITAETTIVKLTDMEVAGEGIDLILDETIEKEIGKVEIPEEPDKPVQPDEPDEPVESDKPVQPEIPEEKLYLSTEIYKIGDNDINNYEEGDKYISRVDKETSKQDFINSLSTNGTVRILKADGTELEDDKLIGTGMTLEVTKGEEKIITQIAVVGDLSGDGKVTATDLSTLNQTILKTITLENEYKIAGDLDENEKITATDLSTLNKMLLKIL